MNGCNYQLSEKLELLNNYFSYMSSLLTKLVFSARRCSGSFKSTYYKWHQNRWAILNHLSQLQDSLPSLNSTTAYANAFCRMNQICDALILDNETYQNLLSIFDEYLHHAVDIKQAFDEMKTNNLSSIVVSIAKVEFQGWIETTTSVPDGELNLFDVLPMIKSLNTWFEGKMESLDTMLELLSYLSCQWTIIDALCILESNKGPICDITLFPDKFLENALPLTEPLRYYDLVSSLSLASSAQGIIMELLKMNQKEIVAVADCVGLKLRKTTEAMLNITRRIEQITELLIVET